MIIESSVWKRPLSLYERGQTMEGKSKASFLERRAAHPNNKMIRTPVCLPSFSILLSTPSPPLSFPLTGANSYINVDIIVTNRF